ncbi:MAG: GxxExxY protein [Bacteroidetes bacterium]|nr:MAG: GxxExxY protein [Bacteroidota bacterium]
MKKVQVYTDDLLYPELSYEIIGCAFDVFNELGSGHKEIYYQKAIAITFEDKGLKFGKEVYYPLKFRDRIVGKNFADFVIENKIVVETKKDNRFSKAHIDQVLNYLNVSKLKLAILINFGQDGVRFKRIVNFDNESESLVEDIEVSYE